MSAARTVRTAAICLCFLTLGSALRAEGTKVVWDPVRTTSPDTVDELRGLESRVKEVVARATPATVGLQVGDGAGSGVIVRDDGLILTAAHVIGNPGRPVTIVLPNGKRVAGKSLGLNRKIDSGMVQITGKPPADATWPGAKEGKWPFVALGKAESLHRGQWVVSLGHPGGPKPERPPPVRVGRFEKYTKAEYVLRTDCTLVGGDSGGPLLDLNGKLVGIHSKIGVFLEFNMHIPTEAFQSEWDKLLAGDIVGAPSRVELGIVLDESADAPTVKSVAEDGPAEKAGMMPGDVIVKFGNEKVHLVDDLLEALSGREPGQTVTVEVRRGDAIVSLKVVLRRKSR